MTIYSNNTYSEDRPNDAWYKLFQFIEPNSTVLDIGCSSGNLGKALKKAKSIKVVGLDIEESDVLLAKKNLDEAHLLNIETDDISHLGMFDIVVFADVIEHLLNPIHALEKVKSVLKPGGKIVFSIPNMANVTIRLELLKGKFAYKDFGLLDRTHLHFYDKQEVERVFTEAGFAIKEYDCTVRNIPDDILKKELALIGIELSTKLKQVMNDSEATIYQFIGYAQVSNAKHATTKSSSSLDSVTREIDGINANHLREVKQKEQIIADKMAENLALAKEVTRLDKELSQILNSKGWKALKAMHSVKAKLPRGRR